LIKQHAWQVIGLAPTEPTTLALDIVKLIASFLLQMKSINQSINQSISQSINKSVSQSINQSINQSVNAHSPTV